MVTVPEFNLNDPFTLPAGAPPADPDKKQELLNQMWRNPCINDTYEPGSTFKIITAAAGLEEGVVTLKDTFSCPGFRIVEDRRIRCHKAGGHGGETFLQGMMNSCNPVLIDVGQRLGTDHSCCTGPVNQAQGNKNINQSSASWEKQGWICREKRPLSCTGRRTWEQWSWQRCPLDSPSRLRLSS